MCFVFGTSEFEPTDPAEARLDVWMPRLEMLANVFDFVVSEVTFEALVDDVVNQERLVIVFT